MLDGIPLVGLSAPAILSVVVMMVMTGRLVPRKTYDDVIRERDEWRAAHSVSEEARRAEASQKTEILLPIARTMEHVLESLPKPKSSEAP